MTDGFYRTCMTPAHRARTICAALLTSGFLCTAATMFDPGADNPDKPWCYLGKSTTVIGVPFVPEPVQVTYDGAVYTRNAELCFFYGETNTPVMARQKRFLDGWIPIVQYDWRNDGVLYGVEIFAAIVPPLESDNVVQFVRVNMRNESREARQGVLTAAIRGTGQTNRKGSSRWQIRPTSTLSFDADSFRRDGRLVYTFSDGAEPFAVPKKPYSAPFKARTYGIVDRSETGIVSYSRRLNPGETCHAEFKMPRVFLESDDAIATLRSADYDAFRAKTVAYWRELIEGRMSFSIPEARVNDSYKAALVHLVLATRGNRGQGNRQGSGLPYDALFLNDYIDMLLAYDLAGLPEFAEPNVDWLLRKQHKSGMFIDVHNRGNDTIVTSHGQGLFCLAYHGVMTRDEAYARKVYPAVRKGVQLIIDDHHSDKHRGLIRPSIPYDAPMVTGYHTCHNLFAVTAVQASIRMARMMGEDQDADAWVEALTSYRQAVLKAVDAAIERDGYITSGLYDWKAGWVQGRKGRVNDHPNQDWENNLLLFPSELMDPGNPRVVKTLATIRARKYREGCMTYRNGMHIHQYVTLNQANQYLAMGDQKHALLDLYHVLLHNGSTHEGFENLVVPWTRLVSPGCPPPHAWAAAKTALFIRNMMVREFGGKGGLKPGERNLHLFSLISPAWARPGNKLEIRNAVTEMGTVSATMAFRTDGADVTIQSDFHTPPARLAIAAPYFVELTEIQVDGRKRHAQGNAISLSPNARRVALNWREKPGIHDGTYQDLLKLYRGEYGYVKDAARYCSEEPPKPVLSAEENNHPAMPLSFGVVRRAFSHEYERRFEKHVGTGGAVDGAQPPGMLKRAAVEASASLGKYPPTNAFDGNHTALESSWQTDPYPAWLRIDLEEERKLKAVRVYPYWGSGRYYRYTVEASADGVEWQVVGDMRENTTPSTPKGDRFEFPPRKIRLIRVNMLYHNLNKGVHIVEVKVERSP